MFRWRLKAAVILSIAPLGFNHAHADCSEIVRLPMKSTAVTPVKDSSDVLCEWRTEIWLPVETCGAFGFEAAGSGIMPVPLIFKRTSTIYTTEWEPHVVDDGWSTASLAPETRGHRCFAGWCTPVSYILRTKLPVEKAICHQSVEIRVRLEDRAE